MAEKRKRTNEQNKSLASADMPIVDRQKSSSRQPHNVSETPTSARMCDSELNRGDSVEPMHSPDVAVRLDHGGDKSVVNKLEHSCNFMVQHFHGHNGTVRSMSLVDDYLITGR